MWVTLPKDSESLFLTSWAKRSNLISPQDKSGTIAVSLSEAGEARAASKGLKQAEETNVEP